MPTAVASALAGVVFGLALAAPPGPMNAVIAEESVLRGWVPGVTAGLGAMTADACFCALALLGLVEVVGRAPAVRTAMVGAGGMLMLYFAYGAARDAAATGGFLAVGAGGSDGRTGATSGDPENGEAKTGGAEEGAGVSGDTAGPAGDGASHAAESRGFRKAFALALTNPYQLLFWLTAGIGMLRPGRLDVLARTPYAGDALAGRLVVETGSPALLVGFFGGIAVWILAFPGTLVALGRRVDRFAAAVAWASAAVLAGFGLLFLSDAVGRLF